MKLATMCYLRDGEKTLMLHRNKKENDMHAGRWVGVGGKLEQGETPEQCILREFREETGLELLGPVMKGILTFPRFSKDEDWYVFLFSCGASRGELIDSPEGSLSWVETKKLEELPMWPGDRLFLGWMEEHRFFSASIAYEDGVLGEYSVTPY